MAAAKVPYNVVTARDINYVPNEEAAQFLAIVSATFLCAAIGVLFQRGGEATVIGMLLGIFIAPFVR